MAASARWMRALSLALGALWLASACTSTTPAASQRGTGDLGVVVERASGSLQVVETTGMTRLGTARVSLAAANQRRGRAGRTAPGVCYRLWSEAAERAFPATIAAARRTRGSRETLTTHGETHSARIACGVRACDRDRRTPWRPEFYGCGSGTNACQLALAMRVAGLPDPLLYVGSFSDWSRAGEAVVTGD